MRFRIEENLQRIADAKGIAPEDASVQLIAALVDAGLLGDKKEDYGEPLSEILFDADPQALYLAPYKVYGKEIPDDLFPAFAGCILMGDGDCPICGCWLGEEVLESEVEDPGDHDTPPTTIPRRPTGRHLSNTAAIGAALPLRKTFPPPTLTKSKRMIEDTT